MRSERYLNTILTPEQEAAAAPHIGRKAVVATAGAGKTTTSAKSIAMKLYGDGGSPIVPDQDILATTFTKAAAAELRHKINSMVGRKTKVIIGTIHSYCLDLLTKHAARIGFSGSVQNIKAGEKRDRMQSILDTTLTAKGLRSDKYGISDFYLAASVYDIRAVSGDPSDLGRLRGWKCPEILLDAYEAYKNYQKVGGFIDYDTMLVFAFEILKGIKDRETAELEGIIIPKHIYVDEAQDLSVIQWAIINELARLSISITVIGDDDQAIYGWRGATVARFKKFYEEADVQCLLTSNRRCPANIVSVGEAIVERIPMERRIAKTLKSGKPVQTGTVMVISSALRSSATGKVIEIIKSAVEGGRAKFKDFAIIYRNVTNVSDEYAQALTGAGVPYRTLGGKDPMDSDEMNLLRYALAVATGGKWNARPEPRGNWIGLLEAAGVSPKAAESIVSRASSRGGHAEDYVAEIGDSRIANDSKYNLLAICNDLKNSRATNRRVTVGDVSSIRAIREKMVNSIYKAADKFAATLLKTSKITVSDIDNTKNQYSTSRITSLDRFLSAMSSMDAAEMVKKLGGLEDDESGDEPTDVVTLATGHSCKGLEWSTVFIVDPLDDIWPSRSATKGLKTKTPAVLSEISDEEKRILYVSVTRAKQNLFLVCPKQGWRIKERGREASSFLGDDVRFAINEEFLALGEDGIRVRKIK